MSRSKNTQYLAIVSALNLLVTSVSAMIIGRVMLVYLGSEYNGINSIVSQFLTILSVLEGGFTTASLVALMKPFKDQNAEEVNQLFAETKAKFHKITILSLLLGCIAAVIYGYMVKTNVPYITVLAVLLIGLVSSTYNIGIISKYRLVFQAAQEEHIFSLITLCTTIIGQIGMLIVLIMTKNIIFMRLVGMFTVLTAGILSINIFSKRYAINRSVKWDGQNRIKGTRDVMIGKLVSTLHSSLTVFFLSIFSSAAITSVYAVYNSVIHFIVSISSIACSAPQNAVGQILQSEENDTKNKIVLEYEYMVILILTFLFVSLSILLIPFVKIYTHGITDVQYVDYLLAVLMVFSAYFQLIHIPAGICIYMSGSFKAAKNIQTIALAILVIGNIVLGNLCGMYGFIISTLLCNIFLSAFEIIYLHKIIIKNSMHSFLHRWIPNVILMFVLIVLGNSLPMQIDSIVSWVIIAILVTIISFVSIFLFNLIILKTAFQNVLVRIKSMVHYR